MLHTAVTKKNNNSRDLYVFSDFETQIHGEEHIPNFCVMQKQCVKYINQPNINDEYDICGKRQYIIGNEGQTLL